MATLKICRISETDYKAVCTGCTVGESYRFDFKLSFEPDWRTGIPTMYPDESGKIETFTWNLPNLEYSCEYKFVNNVTEEESNVVTVDPLNPPIVGNCKISPVTGGFSWLILAVIVFVVIAAVIGGKKR